VFEAILTSLATICAIIVPLYAVWQMKKMQNRIPSFDDFITKDSEGEIIVDERIVTIFKLLGSNIAQSIKMSFLQGLGANAKIEKGLQGAMALDVVENKMPVINLIGDFLGFNTKQYISKNPQAIGQILRMAGPLLKNFNLGNLGNNGTQGTRSGNVPPM